MPYSKRVPVPRAIYDEWESKLAPFGLAHSQQGRQDVQRVTVADGGLADGIQEFQNDPELSPKKRGLSASSVPVSGEGVPRRNWRSEMPLGFEETARFGRVIVEYSPPREIPDWMYSDEKLKVFVAHSHAVNNGPESRELAGRLLRIIYLYRALMPLDEIASEMGIVRGTVTSNLQGIKAHAEQFFAPDGWTFRCCRRWNNPDARGRTARAHPQRYPLTRLPPVLADVQVCGCGAEYSPAPATRQKHCSKRCAQRAAQIAFKARVAASQPA